MSNSFTNQVLAQIELFNKSEQYAKEVYVSPKHLDEIVARLHLDKMNKINEINQRTGVILMFLLTDLINQNFIDIKFEFNFYKFNYLYS